MTGCPLAPAGRQSREEGPCAARGRARREVGGQRAHRLRVHTETMWAYEALPPGRGPSSANRSCVLHAVLGELPLQDASHSFHTAIDGFRRSAYLPLGAAARRPACVCPLA